jgi:hypothetical protein
VLGGVDQLNVLVELNVSGGDFAFFVDGEQQGLRISRVRLEQNLLEIQDDIGDVLDHSINGGEFVHRPINLNGADSGAFQRGKQHAPERVANGIAVTGLKRLGNKLGVGISGGCVFSRQPLGHFEAS